MDTTFLLMARYGGSPLIDEDVVRTDFFSNLAKTTFKRRIDDGDIALPVIRLGGSQKSKRHIHVSDLAKFIDDKANRARQELSRKS